MKKLFSDFFNSVRNLLFLRVIHRALTITIPFIMAGAMSSALLNLPLDFYQNFLALPYMKWFPALLDFIYHGTYAFFAPILVVAISLSYTTYRETKAAQIPFYILISFVSYGTALNIGSPDFSMDSLGFQGAFQALLVTFLTCELLYRLQKYSFFREIKSATGLEIVCSEAIHMIFPTFLICMLWAAFNYLLQTFWGVYSFHALMGNAFMSLFDNLGTGFLSALLYTFLLHLLWLLGFHGSWMLDAVATTNFAAYGPDIIFSHKMFDVFVVMGGCGTTLCALIAILLFSKKKRLRKIAYAASFPALFNINEIINFGIPIVLNPMLAIPFLLVPIEALIISYGAIYLGLCPPVTTEIVWNTPVFFSGYLSTGSIHGILVQVVILIVGTATYVPFLRKNEAIHEQNMKDQLNAMIAEMKRLEADNLPIDFLARTDEIGLLAQMLLRDLKLALKEKQLYLLYQPQMAHDGHCLGAEALIRWKHPVFGFIYPPLLIYIAKAGNTLPEFEIQLFDMASAAIKRISEEYDKDFKVSVNITAKSLTWEGLEGCIRRTLSQYQVAPEKLWLEITEQDILSNSQDTLNKLKQLKNQGHSLLIDDFGMGHTSLIYLQSGYFDVVKLDGSLTKSILTSETNQKIVSSIVDLSRELDINVIAEFVETEAEMQKLHTMGCDWYQGYLYSPAVPLEDFIVYLKEH